MQTYFKDSRLASVTVNGRAVPVVSSQTTVATQVRLRGLRLLEVEAVDLAGNRTVLRRSPADLPQASLRRGVGGGRPWAGLVPVPQDSRPTRVLAQAATGPEARPDVAPAAPGPTMAPADTLPPGLEVSPAVDGPISVTGRTYVLDVEVVDQGGVAAITFGLNGAQETRVFEPPAAVLRRLTHSVHLRPGPNEITVSARDVAGNVRRQTLSVRLAPDPAWRSHLRAGAHVMPTFRPGPTASPLVDLYPPLLAALAKDPARLTMLERDPDVMRAIFRELGISGSSLADARTAVKAGKIAAAEYILVCRGTVWSGPDNYDLFLELVDSATSEVVLTADTHFTSTAEDHVERQLGCLAAKIEQQLPRLTTHVASCSGKRVILPVGSGRRVRRGMYALFLAPAPANPGLAAPLEWEGRWVQGRVEAVETDVCEVILDPKEGSRLVRPQGEVTFR